MRASENFFQILSVGLNFPTFSGVFVNMDVPSVDDWSKNSQQQSPRVLERGGEQQFMESRYEPVLTLVDSGSDPRAWLALLQPSGTCAAHATSPEYLQHSPCPSTGSYHGEKRLLQILTFQSNTIAMQNNMQQADDLRFEVLLHDPRVSDGQKWHYLCF